MTSGESIFLFYVVKITLQSTHILEGLSGAKNWGRGVSAPWPYCQRRHTEEW